ncbi:MAG: HAMP domain-containing histidine kinase [Lachnospiraceae bacterium]|nr:HAMP domain-containing histidine kinase [Lachnospiraceae bacterium]
MEENRKEDLTEARGAEFREMSPWAAGAAGVRETYAERAQAPVRDREGSAERAQTSVGNREENGLKEQAPVSASAGGKKRRLSYAAKKGIAVFLHILSLCTAAAGGLWFAAIAAARGFSGETPAEQLQFLEGQYGLAVALIAASALLWLGSLIALVVLSGKRDGKEGYSLWAIDRVWLAVLLAAAAAAVCFLVIMSREFVVRGVSGILVAAPGFYAVAMVVLFSILRRAKAGTLLSGTMITAVGRCVVRCWKAIVSWSTAERAGERRTVWIYVLYVAANILYFLGAAILLTFAGYAEDFFLFTAAIGIAGFWIFLHVLVARVLTKRSREQGEILAAVQALGAGDVSVRIAPDGYFAHEAALADGINHAGDGIRAAVAEATKAERMRAQLVTNVSHDLKTPLTSIISYVDLLGKEDLPGENAKKYLGILKEKSDRLKALIDDLMEASRAASGSVELKTEMISLREMLLQVQGEYEEKFAARRVTPAFSDSGTPGWVKADSRRLWRVLNNLCGNAAKYAMPGTRFFVTLSEEGGRVLLEMKNVSEMRLEATEEELMERFVRGDASRTGEGSGLGLAIARDLTRLMGGTFDLKLDGDLFVVRLAFPAA